MFDPETIADKSTYEQPTLLAVGMKYVLVNGVVSAACLFLAPTVMQSGSVLLLFLAVGVAYWQYGGGLSLLPALTADYFGPKNLGFNYGLVFIGWGVAFLLLKPIDATISPLDAMLSDRRALGTFVTRWVATTLLMLAALPALFVVGLVALHGLFRTMR